MGQKQDELLKRIHKLVRKNQDLLNSNEKLRKAVDELSEKNEMMKLQLKEAHLEEKSGEQPQAQDRIKKYNMATVLFAYIGGFKELTSDDTSEAAMDQLDEVLIEFDRILKKYKIHKIKTIGDTYMAAGGIPVKNITNPIDVVMAALEMTMFMNQVRRIDGRSYWSMSLGIHTGPVTANVSGKRKISYDIKGDTVNIAHRMQGVGDSGKILISVMTYELIKEFFVCEYYGKMPVKYKGDLEMFVVNGIRSEFSINNKGTLPNALFDTKFKLLQFNDIQELVLDKLESELSLLPRCETYRGCGHRGGTNRLGGGTPR
jgi:class 3 adenylate cyclase